MTGRRGTDRRRRATGRRTPAPVAVPARRSPPERPGPDRCGPCTGPPAGAGATGGSSSRTRVSCGDSASPSASASTDRTCRQSRPVASPADARASSKKVGESGDDEPVDEHHGLVERTAAREVQDGAHRRGDRCAGDARGLRGPECLPADLQPVRTSTPAGGREDEVHVVPGPCRRGHAPDVSSADATGHRPGEEQPGRGHRAEPVRNRQGRACVHVREEPHPGARPQWGRGQERVLDRCRAAEQATTQAGRASRSRRHQVRVLDVAGAVGAVHRPVACGRAVGGADPPPGHGRLRCRWPRWSQADASR